MARSPADRARPDPLGDRPQDPRRSARSSDPRARSRPASRRIQAPFEIEVAAQYFEFYGGLVNAMPRRDHRPRRRAIIRTRVASPSASSASSCRGTRRSIRRHAASRPRSRRETSSSPSRRSSRPRRSLELARIAVEECGLPPGALNVVTGTGAEAGAADRRASARAQGRLHRLRARRPRGRPDRRRAHHPTHARARREVAEHRVRRRRPEAGRARFGLRAFVLTRARSAWPARACCSSGRSTMRSSLAWCRRSSGSDRSRRQGDDRTDDDRRRSTTRCSEYYAIARQEGAVAVAGGALPNDPELREG